jgi:hypothetical protein
MVKLLPFLLDKDKRLSILRSMKCPHCNRKIDEKILARWLGSRGGRKSKVYSEEEKELRRQRLAEARKMRGKK